MAANRAPPGTPGLGSKIQVGPGAAIAETTQRWLDHATRVTDTQLAAAGHSALRATFTRGAVAAHLEPVHQRA